MDFQERKKVKNKRLKISKSLTFYFGQKK